VNLEERNIEIPNYAGGLKIKMTCELWSVSLEGKGDVKFSLDQKNQNHHTVQLWSVRVEERDIGLLLYQRITKIPAPWGHGA